MLLYWCNFNALKFTIYMCIIISSMVKLFMSSTTYILNHNNTIYLYFYTVFLNERCTNTVFGAMLLVL